MNTTDLGNHVPPAALAGYIETNLIPCMRSVQMESSTSVRRIVVWTDDHRCCWINIFQDGSVSLQDGRSRKIRNPTPAEIRILATKHTRIEIERVLFPEEQPTKSDVGVLY